MKISDGSRIGVIVGYVEAVLGAAATTAGYFLSHVCEGLRVAVYECRYGALAA